MEDSPILNWRRWSIIRKAQVLFTAFGVALNIAVGAFNAAQITIPRDSPFDFLFGLSLLLAVPSYRLAGALGIPIEKIGWGWALLVNATLAFGLGTLVGWILFVFKNKRAGGKK